MRCCGLIIKEQNFHEIALIIFLERFHERMDKNEVNTDSVALDIFIEKIHFSKIFFLTQTQLYIPLIEHIVHQFINIYIGF